MAHLTEPSVATQAVEAAAQEDLEEVDQEDQAGVHQRRPQQDPTRINQWL